MRKVFSVVSRVLLCGIIVLVIGRSAVLSQGASNATGTSQSPEITDYYRRMLRYHLRMDGNVPDGAVVFIGDSLTQGLCCDAVACPSVNYGIGSDTTVGVLERLSQYRCVSRASAVVLAIGSNDLDRRDDDQILENYQRVLMAIPRCVPVVCSAVLPVNESLLPASDQGANARILGLNARLKALCAGDSRCVFVDAGSRLVDSEGNLSPSLQDGDGVHLNSDGNRIWIEELRAAVRKAQSMRL
ncbi:MAG: GDSL-type esterase/lipase family protein [Solirubrobacterales bacterium]